MRRRTDRFRAAFTLTEMIVVMTVVLIMLAVSIPTFRSTLASTESSNAETKLRLALQAGRDAALHSDRGADTAVAFFYEPGGRTSAIVCELAGTIADQSDNAADPIERDVFVPVTGYEPIQLPAGYMVRGLVPAGMLDLGGATQAWYEGSRYSNTDRNWVFPENAFFDALVRDDGRDRQSFMIRFVGGIGAVAIGDTREALIVDPRATASARTGSPWGVQKYRVDFAEDLLAKVRRALVELGEGGGPTGGRDARTLLFGDMSGDTVLCRSVEQVALYKELDLASAIGQKLDLDTGSLYQDKTDPTFITKLNSSGVKTNLRKWIEGDTNPDNGWLEPDDTRPDQPVARLYTFQRYTASLQPIPLLNLQDINSSKPAGGGS